MPASHDLAKLVEFMLETSARNSGIMILNLSTYLLMTNVTRVISCFNEGRVRVASY